MKKPLVSVIIPTVNSVRLLSATIASIKQQSYTNIEIVVVDGGSEDDTVGVARKLGARVIGSKRGRSLQKNSGAREANGKYLYFVDDDFIVEPGVVKEAVALLQKGYDMVEVHNTSDPTISFWSKVRKFERDMFRGDKHSVSPRFLPKRIFNSVSGFNEQLVAAEDYDIYNRLRERGYRMGHTKSQEVHIGEPRTLRDIINKHYFYGKTVASSKQGGSKPKLTLWQSLPIKPAYFRNLPRFILHPVLTLGFTFYQVVRFGAAASGFIAGKIKGSFKDRTFRD
ncbi:MAG: glycosyltransferase family 2 protein [Candidatus Dojkabacteria bacterium]